MNSVYAAIIETVDLCARLIHICFRHEPRQIRSEGTVIEVPPPILSPGDVGGGTPICHPNRPESDDPKICPRNSPQWNAPRDYGSLGPGAITI